MGYSLALNAERNSILEKKDVNACDNLANIPIIKKIRINGYTPLISAVHSGSIIAVEFLLLNGSKLNACDFNGQTALHHATILKDLK
jgi:ankyrin repeat protein